MMAFAMVCLSSQLAFAAPPVAGNDIDTTIEDAPVDINVLTNDTGGDGGGIDPATVTVISIPSHGSTNVPGTGVITYTPAADYNGIDTFTYTVKDYLLQESWFQLIQFIAPAVSIKMECVHFRAHNL